MQDRSLGQEDLLEESMATHSILAWRIPMDREACRLQSIGSQRVGRAQLERNTGFSWRHTRGSLRSPWYFMRHPTLAPQLEKTHETPPSSRDEGLLFLHGLESNHESSFQTPQEA